MHGLVLDIANLIMQSEVAYYLQYKVLFFLAFRVNGFFTTAQAIYFFVGMQCADM